MKQYTNNEKSETKRRVIVWSKGSILMSINIYMFFTKFWKCKIGFRENSKCDSSLPIK